MGIPLTTGGKSNGKKTYDPVPKGVYTCEVDKCERAQSKAGNIMWKITLRVVSNEESGRLVFDQLVLKESCVGFVGRFIQACEGSLDGYMLHEDDGIMTKDDIPVKPSDFIGKIVDADVGIEEKDGFKPRNVVNGYREGGEVENNSGTPF